MAIYCDARHFLIPASKKRVYASAGLKVANHARWSRGERILEIRARRVLCSERQESRHPCVQPSACNTNSNVVCSTHTMLSQVLTRHCDIVSAHGSVRNQLSRATAARPVTHIHHHTSLFAACIIRNRYGGRTLALRH